MKIRQIGNGGAFNFNQTNSSFLIKTDEDNFLLFDCGRNVIDKLHKIDGEKTGPDDFSFTKLKYIYISHMDDDHIGSLKSLVYYLFFIIKIKPIIIINDVIYKDLEWYLECLNSYSENGVVIKEKLYIPFYIDSKNLAYDYKGIQIDGNIWLSAFKVNHSIPCAGLRLTHESGTIFISGDTTDIISPKVFRENIEKPRLLFQDFSKYNNINKQVHCCEGHFLIPSRIKDTKKYLDTYGINNIKFYHTGEPFKETFMTIEDALKLENPLLEEIKIKVDAAFKQQQKDLD